MTNAYKMYNGNLIGRLQSEQNLIEHSRPTVPMFQERDWTTGKLLRKYVPFKESVKNSNVGHISPSLFFWTFDAMSPDRKKIVQAMSYLYQINIIDLETGEIKGFRANNTPGFELFKTTMDPYVEHYYACQTDDKYIYCLFNGSKFDSNDRGDKYMPRTIHVFNWDGKLVSKIDLGRDAWEFQLDRVNNRIYTINRLEEIYCYDLSKLGLN
jgi:hypothetical protein